MRAAKPGRNPATSEPRAKQLDSFLCRISRGSLKQFDIVAQLSRLTSPGIGEFADRARRRFDDGRSGYCRVYLPLRLHGIASSEILQAITPAQGMLPRA